MRNCFRQDLHIDELLASKRESNQVRYLGEDEHLALLVVEEELLDLQLEDYELVHPDVLHRSLIAKERVLFRCLAVTIIFDEEIFIRQVLASERVFQTVE